MKIKMMGMMLLGLLGTQAFGADVTLYCSSKSPHALYDVSATVGSPGTTLTGVKGWLYGSGDATLALSSDSTLGVAVAGKKAAAIEFSFQDLNFSYGGYHLILPADFAVKAQGQTIKTFDGTLVSEGTDDPTVSNPMACQVE